MKFEEYLKEVHAKDYMGTDDDMPDAFDEWIIDQRPDDMIQYAQEWGNGIEKRLVENAKAISTNPF